MATVFIPAQLRPLTHGLPAIEVTATTVGAVIDQLDDQFPGLRTRLCEGDQLRSSLQVSVDDRISTRGLLTEVAPGSEVHFVSALGGG